jgi:hypothetical protein
VQDLRAVEKSRHSRRLLPHRLPPKPTFLGQPANVCLESFVFSQNREGHFWELRLADFLHVEARIALAVRQVVVTAQRVRQGFLQIRAFRLGANANEKNRALEV